MKKWLPKMLTLSLILILVLTGCASGGGGTKKNNQAGGSTKTAQKTVINFAAQADPTPGTQNLIDSFNKSQDKYTVKWTQMTNDSAQMHDQLLNSLSSGSSEYDVLSMDVVWAGEFAGAGFLEPLDLKMKNVGFKKADFNAGSMASGNYQGKQFTLPFFPDLGLLYFRKDILSSADATKLVSGNYTYNDLYNMSKKYVGQKNTKYGFLYQSKQYEGLTVNVTEFSNRFKDIKGGLQTMYKFTKAPFEPKNLLNYTEGETATGFEQGHAIFARNWPYQFGRIQTKQSGVKLTVPQVGIAPLPNGGSVGGWLLGINKNSKHPDGAWAFLKYAAGKQGQKIMSTKGSYLPGYNALMTDKDVTSKNVLLTYPGFKKALSTTIARPVSPQYSKVSDTIQLAAHKYLSSGTGLDQSVTKIQNAISSK